MLIAKNNMKIIDFDLEEESSETITRDLIYANATFDIKEVLSNRTSIWCSALSILTPTQAINCAFMPDIHYGLSHASVADTMLSRIYPKYTRTDNVYEKEKHNNIFVITIDCRIVVLDNTHIITPRQFKDLSQLLKDAANSDYCKPNENGKTHFYEFVINNEPFSVNEVDSCIEYIKNYNEIGNVISPEQYDFSKYTFDDCKTEADFLRQSAKYAKEHFNQRKIINSDDGR